MKKDPEIKEGVRSNLENRKETKQKRQTITLIL